MINNVVLVGRLTAAPDLRKTPSNVSALQGTLAVNRNFKNQNGEREADFINFQAWRGTADIIAEYCGKGSLIGITGRIQTRNYENQQGQRVYVTEVVADSVALLESRNSQQNRGNDYQNGNSSQGGNWHPGGSTQSEFASDSSSGYRSPFGGSNPMNISDDDLPF
ncbi:single-stranded DNA-binding protein [Streptococcus hyointestinalis]|uniref:single-stranded DNA-binding protein n=1 Tax=Streptococcus hyointestinalis TaxID=1337 RepID=UPI0023F16FDB|nr:single-stranded DNA-binding protein [Streptococcus hyointestinalis]MDD7356621.1 single-stranded DNA-binding protein [Streptococcus hyointestinalis]MDY4553724.1 single-stranded DNA-binding protein [Streptococcus hyointestinalis]